MPWYTIAGFAMLALAGAVALTHRSGVTATHSRGIGALLLQVVPMLALALLTLDHQQWALVVGAIFASVWLLDQLLSWRRRDPVRPRRSPRPSPAAHALLSLVSLAVAALTWAAVAAAHITPVA